MGSGIGSLQDIANTDRTLLNEVYISFRPFIHNQILYQL